jgi:hypothetical protein
MIQASSRSDGNVVNRSSKSLAWLGIAALFKPVHYALHVGISGSELPREPVPASLGNLFTVGDHVKLTRSSGCNHGGNAQTLADEGCETRNLRFIVASGWARNNLDFHSVLH